MVRPQRQKHYKLSSRIRKFNFLFLLNPEWVDGIILTVKCASLCLCPAFQMRKGRLSKLEAFEGKIPSPVVKKINVKVNYWSKVRKPLIAVYLHFK